MALAAKIALLDRDGTLIDVVRDEESGLIVTAFHPSHVRLLPGVQAGLSALVRAGWLLAIVTNQPGPAKGHFTARAVVQTNAALVDLLHGKGIPIARVEVCMHHPDGGPGGDPSLVGPCDCRKPAPGLLLRAIAALGGEAGRAYMFGDSAVDVRAARAAGVRAGLVFDQNCCELCPLRGGPGLVADAVANRFDVLVTAILDKEHA
jgi:D-glycero-D-manno-heptose 1,7-bisphosphate phosphatase